MKFLELYKGKKRSIPLFFFLGISTKLSSRGRKGKTQYHTHTRLDTRAPFSLSLSLSTEFLSLDFVFFLNLQIKLLLSSFSIYLPFLAVLHLDDHATHLRRRCQFFFSFYLLLFFVMHFLFEILAETIVSVRIVVFD